MIKTILGPCLLQRSHGGNHKAQPTLWNNILHDPGDRTYKKIVKAGFATPRGGAKGGYQNHVTRSSRVIIPFEHADKVNFSNYEQGAVIRVTAPQAAGIHENDGFENRGGALYVEICGEYRQAFVLYRSQSDLETFPIPENWYPCEMQVNGISQSRRSANGVDVGHYLRRVPRDSKNLGIQQGIFAPEYTRRSVNYACQVFLTHLAYRTEGHPRDPNADHVEEILKTLNIYNDSLWRHEGIIDKDGVSTCPLCNRRIAYEELHETIDPSLVPGLANSGVQLGETRSTLVNLYHLRPLLYASELGHTPQNIAWGHAHCNTFLAQRVSFSLRALMDAGKRPDLDLYWDDNEEFIRASDGRAWVSLTPMPAGAESFSEYIRRENLDNAIEPEMDDEVED